MDAAIREQKEQELKRLEDDLRVLTQARNQLKNALAVDEEEEEDDTLEPEVVTRDCNNCNHHEQAQAIPPYCRTCLGPAFDPDRTQPTEYLPLWQPITFQKEKACK